MAQRKLTINLPRSPEILHELIVYLLKRGLISENEAHSLEKEESGEPTNKKSRWALAAERFDSEGFLDGHGEDVKELSLDFREGFSF